MSKMLGNSDLSRKEHPFLGKLYSSRRTSAFGNPLVRDMRVLVSDGRTSGSFLPWFNYAFHTLRIMANHLFRYYNSGLHVARNHFLNVPVTYLLCQLILNSHISKFALNVIKLVDLKTNSKNILIMPGVSV